MCIYKRILFTCGHASWGHEINTCTVPSCDDMYSHPFHTIRLGSLCTACKAKRGKVTGTMSKVRMKMDELKNTVSKIQSMREEKKVRENVLKGLRIGSPSGASDEDTLVLGDDEDDRDEVLDREL